MHSANAWACSTTPVPQLQLVRSDDSAHHLPSLMHSFTQAFVKARLARVDAQYGAQPGTPTSPTAPPRPPSLGAPSLSGRLRALSGGMLSLGGGSFSGSGGGAAPGAPVRVSNGHPHTHVCLYQA